MVGEILLCALGAAAVLVLCWLLLARLLLPMQTKQSFLVLPCRGDGDTMEQDCRAYLLLRSIGALQQPLLLVDSGLSEEGRRLAGLMTTLDPSIELCQPQALQARLRYEAKD